MTRTATTSPIRTATACVAIALGVLATPVQAQLVEIQWDASDAFERSLMLAPAKFVEVCGKLRKGQSIDWSFTGQSPLNFNIHYHEGKKVVFPAKHDHAESLSGKLTVPADQDYCWMWENKSDASASIALRMRRD